MSIDIIKMYFSFLKRQLGKSDIWARITYAA